MVMAGGTVGKDEIESGWELATGDLVARRVEGHERRCHLDAERTRGDSADV